MITTAQAARLAGVSVRTIQNWSAAGLIIPVVLGGRGPGSQNTYQRADILRVGARMKERRRRAPSA